MLRLIKRVLGISTRRRVSQPDFPTVVYTTRPDPTEYMTEAERRYHLNNHAGR